MSFPDSPDAPGADSSAPPERVEAHSSFFARITFAPVLDTLPTWRMFTEEDDTLREVPRLVFFAGADEPRPQEFSLRGEHELARCAALDAGEGTIRTRTGERTPLDFGAVSTQCRASRTVRLQNCSLSELLSIAEVSVEGDVSFGAAHEPSGRGQAPYIIEPLGVERYSLSFAPSSAGARHARLHVKSTEGTESVVDLRGEGASDASTYAVYARARVAGFSAVPHEASADDPLIAPHYATMELIANSDRPTSDGITYRWRIVKSPTHSTSSLDASDPGRAMVFLDALGEYVFEVTGVDRRGVQSCAPARVHVQTEHRGQAMIELRWVAPVAVMGEDELRLWHPGGRPMASETHTGDRMQVWYLDPEWTGALELWVKTSARGSAERLFPIVRIYDEVADEGFEWEPEIVAHASLGKGASSWQILRLEREEGGRTRFVEIEAPEREDDVDYGNIRRYSRL